MLHSQSKDDAALYAIWSDTTKPEVDRIDAYFDRLNDIKLFLNEQSLNNKWFEASDEAIALAIRFDKKEYLPLFYLTSSFNFGLNKHDFQKGCLEAEKVLESAKLANASKFPVFTAYMILLSSCTQVIKDEAFLNEFHKIESTLSDTPEDLKIRQELNSAIGNYYINKDQYPKALSHLQESLRLAEDLNLIDASYARNNEMLAIIHTNIGNYTEAEKYIDKSLQLSHRLKDTFNLGSEYVAKSSLMIERKDEIKAQIYIDSALYIMKNVKHCEPCYNYAKIVNAGIRNLAGDYSAALTELSEVEAFFDEEGGVINAQPEFFIEKAKAYMGLKKYDDAIKMLNTTKALGQSYFKTASDRFDMLVKAYEAKGDYKAALKNYKNYVQVEDSMNVLRNSSEVTRLELENQFTSQQLKAELEFQTQLNRQKTTKNLLIILGIGALLAAIGLLYRLKFIRKTQEVLEQKNKIIEAEKEKAQASERAKHQFLANMSHEIRTPMNAIKGMTDILIRRDPKDDQKDYLDSIKQSSESLLIVINDILDISKIEAGKIEFEIEPFQVNDLIDNVFTIMQFKAEEKGLELKKDIPAEPLYVKGDVTRLRQILINLIGNAIKFTDKGIVTTTLHTKQVDDAIHLHFTVSDTGIGIDKDRLEKIFNSFEQAYSDTSRKFGGTGLGLSISKMLVELQNGKIWVTSEKGIGSQFHFTIPYEMTTAPAQEANDVAENSNIAGTLKGIHILLVEDNPFNVVVAQEELEDAIEGVQVDVAENGAIAVEKMRSSGYDVILMDVQMPKMNGYEATIAIRGFDNEKANTPIIAMTANVLKEEVDLCYQAGMNDFIGKPFDTNELLQKIYNLKTKTND
ncbi:MAG: response regulator [Saprospiraceae bacterium]|nr:response regulator [Candidatus Opimibacter iunctus]